MTVAEIILGLIKDAGHAVFADGAYDLNIFGVRSEDNTPNVFNDLLGCVYKCDAQHWHCETWPATTDPGVYWLHNPSNVNGTAILIPGQYRGVYKKDLHSGKYLALCQRNGPVKVWRDSDKDGKVDTGGRVYEGMFGINIHHASYSGTSTQVNKWSAGCQVIANIKHFDRLMWLVDKQLEYHPTWTKFTYTLLSNVSEDIRDATGASIRQD